MAALKLGKLTAHVKIDRSWQSHYGPNDQVTGQVILDYGHNSSVFKKTVGTADLFGPLLLEVTLHGKVKTEVKRERDGNTTHHGGLLFSTKWEVYNGSFETTPGKQSAFPFAVTFPESTVSGQPLPPTLLVSFSDYPDKVYTRVQYKLGIRVCMRGIDIKTIVPSGGNEPHVRYELPPPPFDVFEAHRRTFRHESQIQNEFLLPEGKRPQGFKQKTKAMFSSSHFPTFAFEITCTEHPYVYVGQELTFHITLSRVGGTAEFFPEARLDNLRVVMNAFTTVDTSNRMFGSDSCQDNEVVQFLQGEGQGPLVFSKQNEYSVIVATSPVSTMASSFEHALVSRRYSLRLLIDLNIANKSVRIDRQFPVTVLSPPADWQQVVETGPSRAFAEPEHVEDDAPPTYEEAGPSAPRLVEATDP